MVLYKYRIYLFNGSLDSSLKTHVDIATLHLFGDETRRYSHETNISSDPCHDDMNSIVDLTDTLSLVDKTTRDARARCMTTLDPTPSFSAPSILSRSSYQDCNETDQSEPAEGESKTVWMRRCETTPLLLDRCTPLPSSALWAIPPKYAADSRRPSGSWCWWSSHENAIPEPNPSPHPLSIDMTTSSSPPPLEQYCEPFPSPISASIHPLTKDEDDDNNELPCFLQPEWPLTPVSPRQPQDGWWGERPPPNIVCQHMDRYFSEHDLDKPWITTRAKSIRAVACEAANNMYDDYSNMHHTRRLSSMTTMRRKSTKFWDQSTIQVKADNMIKVQKNKGGIRWIRGKLLGQGSFGRVHMAFNVVTGEVIAVKQVNVSPPFAKEIMIDGTQLHQEIAMLRDLDHENIVQYLGYDEDESEGVINIFLEYVSGGSIASRLAIHGAFPESIVRFFTRQICMGLAYLHSKGILHRDIKAANILIEADGVCKISDFGLSKRHDFADQVYDANDRMSLRGSIYWMAPEVVKNQPYSAKVDIWSLGCTVLEMLTGERPWLTFHQLAAFYNLGCQKKPRVPETIADTAKDFLNLCFAIDPRKRPTANDLLNHQFCYIEPDFDFAMERGKI
ncbi:mitogen-activated protein kinase kinase kinase [Lichtheimia corymbifera JMRC:FSU:9682]|uniref:Mitogen-activated protein kinase kinase kinase n=1 Tax=Lichtheimia corymbifera JMRC:FSU:9682 TaxID=1263082 RepID=A0A068RTM1_9FUNG|nr:mitogen-activated protein kinase kinase kinase [Lichtheimia corymbifera JMRC:FSU:9682]